MANEIANNAKNPSFMKEMGTTLMFPGTIAGFGGLTSIGRNRGVKKAIDSLDIQDFKKLNITLKNNGKDIFTRGVELSQNYDAYKQIQKKAIKLQNAANKEGLSLFEKFKNLFRAQDKKVTKEIIEANSKKANEALSAATKNLANGKDIIEEGAKLAGKTGKQTAKNLFKSEMKNKFVLGITIMAAIPRIKEEIVPAFKEKGFFAGIKATGKVIARTCTDFVSNAGFSAIGRAIGTAVGSIICPGAGSAVGGTFGDVIGSFFSMKLVEKVFDKNKKAKEAEVQQELDQEQVQNFDAQF